jgi:hypothetical protein
VATEHLSRLDPPTTLTDVVRQLLSREAAGLAVRGEVDQAAVAVAEAGGLPLLLLDPEAPLHDIEQAIMRECALHQARREMLPAVEGDAWIEDLLAGRFASAAEAQSAARRQGYRPATHYTVAYIPYAPAPSSKPKGQSAGQGSTASLDFAPWSLDVVGRELETRFKTAGKAASPITRLWDAGLAVLLPGGYDEARLLASLNAGRMPSGIGTEGPLLAVPESLVEAQLAASASALLYGGRPARYSQLGADRLLIMLYRDHSQELEAFVQDTLGPLLRYDEGSSSPMLPTLQAFVTHGGRLRETASQIFVHRNTLAYRLDRAAEILGVDLKDPSARLAIELALRALPLVSAR